MGRLRQAAERRQGSALQSGRPGTQQFANPVHCVKIAKDGLVYVCDRTNDRIQVFRKDGTFVKEFFVAKDTLQQGSVWDLDFWPDAKQTFLMNADGANNEVRTLVRETGEVVGRIRPQRAQRRRISLDP